MPDVVTPAELRWSGGTVLDEPAFDFVSAAILLWTGGTITDGPSSSLSDSPTTPKLDRIQRQETIVETNRVASQRFQRIWQTTMEAIERAFSGQQGQITDLATIVARLAA